MDYGKLAYVKCEDLEAELTGRAARAPAKAFRCMRVPAGSVPRTDALTVTGRGTALVVARAFGGELVSVTLDGQPLACAPVPAAAAEVSGEARVAFSATAGTEEISLLCLGEGVRFRFEDCACTDGQTVYLARGGRMLGFSGGEAVSDSEQFGQFSVTGGVLYSLADGTLCRSDTLTARGSVLETGVSCFAAEGERLCYVKDGRLFGAGAEIACPGAEALRFVDGELVVERGGASWRRTAAGFVRLTDGTGACVCNGTLYASRRGVVFAGETPAALGEEAIACGGTVFVRSGSNLFSL